MNITQEIRTAALEQAAAAGESEEGMRMMSEEFKKKGSEIYMQEV